MLAHFIYKKTGKVVKATKETSKKLATQETKTGQKSNKKVVKKTDGKKSIKSDKLSQDVTKSNKKVKIIKSKVAES